MAKGSALKGALAAMPRGGRVTSLPVNPTPSGVLAGVAQGIGQNKGLQRLSPGVYRNQQGNLVNSSGGALPGQRQQQRPPVATPDLPQMPMRVPPQASWRPPAPNPSGQGNVMWMGGSPNFNEQIGMYNQPATQYPGQDYWKNMQGGFGTGQGIVAQQPFSPEQQAYQQALQQEIRGLRGPQMSAEQQAQMMAQKQAFGQGQLTPEQQAFNQQQAAGNSLTRMMPDGRMVY